MAHYENTFHALSNYTLQLITSEKADIRYFVKGLNMDLLMSKLLVDISRKTFQEVVEFMKKVKRVNKKEKIKAQNFVTLVVLIRRAMVCRVTLFSHSI